MLRNILLKETNLFQILAWKRVRKLYAKYQRCKEIGFPGLFQGHHIFTINGQTIPDCCCSYRFMQSLSCNQKNFRREDAMMIIVGGHINNIQGRTSMLKNPTFTCIKSHKIRFITTFLSLL